MRASVDEELLEELRNFGRRPVECKKPATPAQEHERVLAQNGGTVVAAEEEQDDDDDDDDDGGDDDDNSDDDEGEDDPD